MEGHWQKVKAKLPPLGLENIDRFLPIFTAVYVKVYEQRGGLVPKVFRNSKKQTSRFMMYLRRVTLIIVILYCDMLQVISRLFVNYCSCIEMRPQ